MHVVAERPPLRARRPEPIANASQRHIRPVRPREDRIDREPAVGKDPVRRPFSLAGARFLARCRHPGDEQGCKCYDRPPARPRRSLAHRLVRSASTPRPVATLRRRVVASKRSDPRRPGKAVRGPDRDGRRTARLLLGEGNQCQGPGPASVDGPGVGGSQTGQGRGEGLHPTGAWPPRGGARPPTRGGPRQGERPAYFLRWRILLRIRRFFRPTLRRPFPRRRLAIRSPGWAIFGMTEE